MENYIDRILAEMPDEAQMTAKMGNDFDSTYLGRLPLGMAYVPFQRWQGTYEPYRALDRGTIFPELDLPFCGRELI